ncbi:MAG: phosphatidate cytidylyltransferase [Gammaproteobacteria bacterium]|nr:phosphatidate cytidylyltransferase [Gammaproteobacteria bacterium]
MLKQRVMTALALAAVALIVIFLLPHAAMKAALALLVVAGAWEWSVFRGAASGAARLAYAALIALGVAIVWHLDHLGVRLEAVLYAALVWWIVAFVWVVTIPGSVSNTAAGIAGLFVLIPAWLGLVKLHEHSPTLMLFLVMLVVAADVGAYFVGRRFGRHKLAPRVSPGKTWEGVLGGFLCAGLVGLLGVFWFSAPAARFLGLCFIVIVASIVGDLTESLFKRHAGVKDSGNWLPGHGGVLDRVDSMTAAAPVFLVGLERLGLFR